MRTRTILALSLLACAATASAQSAVDAYNITPTQLRGSARFIGMGGAFTSLGSDITCMTQNPAGLGLYRHSDIGLTFDISIRNYSAKTEVQKYSENETRAKFDNFGYVGVANLNGAMKAFQWGVSYNRLAVMDRITSGYNRPTDTSLSNYIAWYTNGVNSNGLLEGDNYDPYFDSNNDWLSILAYNSFMINNPGNNEEQYSGLYQRGTEGDAYYKIRERGYTDEYNIDFAGNISDMVFWGIGVGIIDMNYTREGNYNESMAGARVYEQIDDNTSRLTTGNAGFNLYNWQNISGSGANLKFGLIVRPVEMLRLGFAIHTPTWMHLSHSTYGATDYNYTPDNPIGDKETNSGTFETPDNYYDSKLNTPWRFMVGASLVLGPKAIISVDYERVAYNDMKLKEQRYYDNFGGGGYIDNEYANQDVKDYFRAANIIRFGAEYRLNRNWSVRAGYNYQSSNVRKEAADGALHISTAGTDPSYRFDNNVENICLGLGYRYKSWYIDLAYQHTRQNGKFHAYTPFTEGNTTYYTPEAKVKDCNNNIVISTGFRF